MTDSVAASPVGVWLKSLDLANYNLFLPGVVTAPINQGIETEMRQRRNERGVNVLDFEQQNAQMPSLAITFSKWSRELIALMAGYQLADSTLSDALYMRTVRLNRNTLPAATTGKAGHGMTANQTTSEMVAYVGGQQIQLTRAAFSGFDHAVDDTFAQGANGAILVADNLVGPSNFATHFFRYSVTGGQALIDAPFDRFSAVIHYVLPDQTIFEVTYAELALSKAANSTVDLTAAPTVNFLAPNPSCLVNWRFHNRRYDCFAA